MKTVLKPVRYWLCEVKGGEIVVLASRKTWKAICNLEAKHKPRHVFVVTESYCTDPKASDHGEVYWFDCGGTRLDQNLFV